MWQIAMRVALLAGGVFLFPLGAGAQPYCANYSDGTRDCGIPSLTICQQSVSGVGGYCGPDQTSRIPPNLMQRRRQANSPRDPWQFAPSDQQPSGLNWMPPPPGQ